jgi:DNA-binding CsgD family transcriptional regulator
MTEVAHLTIRLRLFSDRVHNCEHPTEVIERLHQAVSPSVNVLGAWRVPARYDNWSAWKMNANVFCQKRVPPNLFHEWLLLAQKYGQSAMAAKAARDGTPFTWSECMRDLKLSGNGRWVFDELLWPHRMRDGFCCPIGPWVLHYWSSKPLRLSPTARSLLYSAAVSAVEQLMRLTARQRITDAPPAKHLTPREIEVMRLYSIGSRPRQIAQGLGIKVSTARDHLRNAQKKLGARHVSHAVALAIRGNLLELWSATLAGSLTVVTQARDCWPAFGSDLPLVIL